MDKKWLFLLLISGIFNFAGTVSAEVFPVSDSRADICILSQDTEFKQKLVATLVEQLNAQKVSVTVEPFPAADEHSPSQYDAVLLLSGIEAFHPLPETVSYIQTHDYAANIVYFSTHTLFKAPYGFKLKRRKIDAITSASKLESEVLDRAADNLVTATLKTINTPR